MRWTLKELLKQCRLALKKNTSKRDKWVKEWAGQVIMIKGKISQLFLFRKLVLLSRSVTRIERHVFLQLYMVRTGFE